MINKSQISKILKSVGNEHNFMDLDIYSGLSNDTTESSFKEFLLNEYGLSNDYENMNYNDILSFYQVDSIKELKGILEQEQEQGIKEIIEIPIKNIVNNTEKPKIKRFSTEFILFQIKQHKPKKEYVTAEQKRTKRLMFLEMLNRANINPIIRC